MVDCSEFALIERYLSGLGADRADVVLGVGDDAAIVHPPVDGYQLMALDTLVAGVHFPKDFPPEWIGHRALAVNLSDIAAMGGQPQWALLGLTLPKADEAWVSAFARGFDALAKAYNVALIGGDVTQGPLAITVQITGTSSRPPLRRDGAQPGDRLWVSGRPGEAAAGLAVWQSADCRANPRWQGLLQAFTHPRPRLGLGQRLARIATAAIDVSDGIVADAGHIARRSGVKLVLDPALCRPSARLLHWAGTAQAAEALWQGGGDDYELCFTAPADATHCLLEAARAEQVIVRPVGRVESGVGVYWGSQHLDDRQGVGYEHFRNHG